MATNTTLRDGEYFLADESTAWIKIRDGKMVDSHEESMMSQSLASHDSYSRIEFSACGEELSRAEHEALVLAVKGPDHDPQAYHSCEYDPDAQSDSNARSWTS